MGVPMLVPRCSRREKTIAHVAGKFFDAIVNVAYVSVQTGRRSEAFVAGETNVGSLTSVNVAVDYEIIRGGEKFFTFFALVINSSVIIHHFRASSLHILFRYVISFISFYFSLKILCRALSLPKSWRFLVFIQPGSRREVFLQFRLSVTNGNR